MAENENKVTQKNKKPEALIKVSKSNPDFMHIQDLTERTAAQFRKGQFFKKSDHSVIEIIDIKDDHIMFKFIRRETGKRIFKLSIFAQLYNNNYFMQIPDPDQKIEWELNQTLELERYLR